MLEHEAYTLRSPTHERVPVLIELPHSGRDWPRDFLPVLDAALIHQTQAGFADLLFEPALTFGATVLAARFPRVYVDADRGLGDIDEALLDAPWPGPLMRDPRGQVGTGLAWRLVRGQPLYAHRLGVVELRSRIERFWKPYRDVLWLELDRAHARFAARWHLQVCAAATPWAYRSEQIRLSDLGGASADAATVALLQRELRAAGLQVSMARAPHPDEVLRRSGDPRCHCHALRLEINPALYMDAAKQRLHEGFAPLRSALRSVVAGLCEHARSSLGMRR